VRVAFLTHNYPRHAGDLPGSFLHPLAVALRARGVDIRVVAPSDAGHGGEEILDGVPVRRVRYASPGRERYAYSGRMLEALRSPAGWVLPSVVVGLMIGAGFGATCLGAAAVARRANWWVTLLTGVGSALALVFVTTSIAAPLLMGGGCQRPPL